MKDLETYLKHLEELCEKATPGPWDNRCREFSNTEIARHVWSEYGWLAKFESPLQSADKDAEFTAESRTAIPLLLKLVRKYREALEAVPEHHALSRACKQLHNIANEALAYDPREEK